jgi:hypothetical protein
MKHLFGRRARIKGITDLGDTDLNGRTGYLCAKHFVNVVRNPRTILGDIGIVLDGEDRMRCANLNYGEFEEIKDEESEAIVNNATHLGEHDIRVDRLQ